MDLALAGQIIGRIFAAYIIVWIIMWVVARFNIKRAFFHTHRWYGFIALVFIFFLGMASHLIAKGGV